MRFVVPPQVRYSKADFDAAAAFVTKHNEVFNGDLNRARELLTDLINRGLLEGCQGTKCGGFYVVFEPCGEGESVIYVSIFVRPDLSGDYMVTEWVRGEPLPLPRPHEQLQKRTSWERLLGGVVRT